MSAVGTASSTGAVDCVLRGRVLSRGVVSEGAVGIRGGKIVFVSPDPDFSVSAEDERRLSDDEVLIPGIVDTHVHVNEPGRTQWEGFDYATRAAIAGGVTTIIDMPLNSNPPTLTTEALELKRRVAGPKSYCEVGFWGGVDSSNLGRLRPLWDEGVFGFKCFLSPSGVDEYGSLRYDQLRDAMSEIASFGGRLIIHAEDPDDLAAHTGHIGETYRSFVETRPSSSEATAVSRVMELVRLTGCRTHILHVSSAATVSVIADAKSDGLPVTAETCPHYLTLDCDHIPDADTSFKCCPPIRDRHNQDALWRGLVDGTLDIVVTDHSPTTPQMKAGTLSTAWGGVSSLQVGFRAVLTAAERHGLGLADVVRWMSSNTADFVGLHDRGAIAPGLRADLAVIRPGEQFVVRARDLESRNPISAFDGMVMRGVVSNVLVAGMSARPEEGHLIRRM